MEHEIVSMGYDTVNYRHKLRIGLEGKEPYYNDDVLLVDLSKWKTANCTERILRSIMENRETFALVEQDGINVVLNNNIKPLSFRYNLLSQCFLYKYEDVLKIYGLHPQCYGSQADFDEAIKKPIICHFSGLTFIRPWYKNSRHPLKKIYDKYYLMSEWGDIPQEVFKLPLPYKIQMLAYYYMPRRLSALLGKMMQTVFGVICCRS